MQAMQSAHLAQLTAAAQAKAVLTPEQRGRVAGWGDALRLRSTVLESRPSRSKPERGLVSFRWELLNQADEVVLSMLGHQFYLRRMPVAP